VAARTSASKCHRLVPRSTRTPANLTVPTMVESPRAGLIATESTVREPTRWPTATCLGSNGCPGACTESVTGVGERPAGAAGGAWRSGAGRQPPNSTREQQRRVAGATARVALATCGVMRGTIERTPLTLGGETHMSTTTLLIIIIVLLLLGGGWGWSRRAP
jgi:hypothetical protein